MLILAPSRTRAATPPVSRSVRSWLFAFNPGWRLARQKLAILTLGYDVKPFQGIFALSDDQSQRHGQFGVAGFLTSRIR
jgi:hypothetical protein